MNNIFKQINGGSNICDILISMMKEQKEYEYQMSVVNFKGGDLQDRLDDIESNYEFNKEKPDYIYEIGNRNFKIQRKFLELIIYVDRLDISRYNALSTILASSILLSELEDHPELLSVPELYLVSTAMISIPICDYKMYGEVLINRDIIRDIMAKTNDENEQRNICYDIFYYCDEDTTNNMTKEQYECAINDSKNIIKDYQVKETQKNK